MPGYLGNGWLDSSPAGRFDPRPLDPPEYWDDDECEIEGEEDDDGE